MSKLSFVMPKNIWETSMHLNFRAAPLLLLTFVVACQRSSLSQPPAEVKHYPHAHLQSPHLEPQDNLGRDDYKLQRSDTLESLAHARYGHRKYAAVVKLYNHIEDETAIKEGTTLHVPDMSVVLDKEGVTKVAANEVQLILCARAKYDKVVAELLRRHHERGTYVLPETIQLELLQAAYDLQRAADGLKVIKPGVSNVPAKMIGQLQQTMWGIRDLATTDQSDRYGYDIDMVHQRYALALSYAIIWAREGFR